jgi:hypothetical protein
VKRLEHRAGHVPVVVVRLEVERVGVGQQARESLGYLAAVALLDAYVDGHGLYLGPDFA